MLIVRKPCELESLRELLGIERAAVRVYDRAIASCEGPVQGTLRQCRRSHVARALYLSGGVRRMGGSLDIGAPGTALYGMGFSQLPDDPLLLLAAFEEGEERGITFYEELSPESGTERRTLKYLRRHQARALRMLSHRNVTARRDVGSARVTHEPPCVSRFDA